MRVEYTAVEILWKIWRDMPFQAEGDVSVPFVDSLGVYHSHQMPIRDGSADVYYSQINKGPWRGMIEEMISELREQEAT